MKKLLTLTLMLTLLLLSLASCKLGGDSGDEELITPDTVWSASIDTVIVTDSAMKEIDKLVSHVNTLTGKPPAVVVTTTSPAAHEIVLDKGARPISEKAYAKLDRYVDLASVAEEEQSAYIIYAEGGSVAIAYSDDYAKAAAINYIVANITDATYTDGGVVVSQVFKTSDFVDQQRKEEQNKAFAEIEDQLGGSATEILKMIYDLYGSELYIWLANLYDPDIGGFYYSNSARNTLGYLPDIESTVQGLRILENSGMSESFNNSWVNIISDEQKAQLLAFAQGLQSPDDGYFYHPQWGNSISSSRKGRDHGWARQLIEDLGAEPLYPYGADRTTSVTPTKAMLTDKLGASCVEAVAKVISSKVEATAFDVSSKEAFEEFLSGVNSNSYSIGNVLNSNTSIIKKAGLWNFMIDYLKEHQYPNGLWEKEVSYNSVNGLMKMCTFFGNDFPNAEAAIDSTISIMLRDMDEELEAIVFVYNPWVAIYNVMGSCSAAKQKELREMLIARAPEIFNKTYQKLGAFRKADGGFSYLVESSSSTSQGELVAVPGSPESDINATGIAISTVLRYMLKCYGVTPPALYYEYDAKYFRDIMDGLGTIVKDTTNLDDPEVMTFDEYDPDDGQEVGGVVKYPANNAQNNIGNTTVDEKGNYKWFTSQVVPNPTDPTGKDLVLYSKDFVYDENGDGKIDTVSGSAEVAGTQSSTEFYIGNYGINGNCYILDLDMYFESSEASNLTDCLGQIIFCQRASSNNSAWLNFYSYNEGGKTYLRLAENWTGVGGYNDSEVVAGIPTDEWVNLRIETYKDYDENQELLVRMKIYINGEYAGYSDSGYYRDSTKSYVDYTISAVKFLYYRTSATAYYLNNVYAAKAMKPYTEEAVAAPEYSGTDTNDTVHNFENGIPTDELNIGVGYLNSATGSLAYVNQKDWTAELDAAYGIDTKKGGIRFYSVSDPKNSANKVLKIYTWNVDNSRYASQITVMPDIKSETGNVTEVEFDYYFETIPWLFSQNYMALEFQDKFGTKLNCVTFAAESIPTDNKNMPNMILKDGSGKVIPDFSLKADTWYTFKFEYYTNAKDYTQSRLKVYIVDKNDNYVCIYDDVSYLKSGEVAKIALDFTPYKIRGINYIDDLSARISAKTYAAETVVKGNEVQLPVVKTPTIDSTGATLDFEASEITSGITSNTFSQNSVSAEGTVIYSQTTVNATATRPGDYGVFFSLANDPAGAANRVLKASTAHAGGADGYQGVIKLDAGEGTSKVHVVEYDYYFVSNSKAKATLLNISYIDADGNKIGGNPTAAYNTAANGSTFQIGTTSTTAEGTAQLSANRWYRIRIVWDQENGKIYYFYSVDSGTTWQSACATANRASSTEVKYVHLIFQVYNNTGVQYIDNITYSRVSALPQ